MAKTEHAGQAPIPTHVDSLPTSSGKVRELRPGARNVSTFDPAATLIRMPELLALTGWKRPTVYKRLKDDPTFPRPVPLSDSTARNAPVAWVLSEVESYIKSRIAARGEVAA